MTYKIALEVLFNGELENELRERDLVATLGMQKDSDRERIMKTVDQLRRSELYPHDKKDCSEQCRTKGINFSQNVII